MASIQQSSLKLGEINVEIAESGSGRPVVFLHSGDGLANCAPPDESEGGFYISYVKLRLEV